MESKTSQPTDKEVEQGAAPEPAKAKGLSTKRIAGLVLILAIVFARARWHRRP